MIWLLSAVLFLASSPTTPAANPSRVWLVIGASEKTPAGIASKAQELAGTFPKSLVFTTADCGDKRAVLGLAVEIVADAASATAAIERVRPTVKDAYLKRCDVKPQSLLAYRLSAVDPSIARVPTTAVNWDDEDRLSSVQPLSGGRAVAAIRYFDSVTDDPVEGKRTKLVLVGDSNQVTLTQNCNTPEAVVVRKSTLAVQCVVEQAADNLLHNVLVFSLTGQLLTTIDHCRAPRWSSDALLLCSEESVDAVGQLKTQTKKVPITSR